MRKLFLLMALIILFKLLALTMTLLRGGGKAGITIQFKNCLADNYWMNSTNTNVGGWDKSEMRTYLNDVILLTLPADLQSVIKPVNKLTSEGNTSSTIITSVDKLFLLSHIEIMGTTEKTSSEGLSFTGEGTQYEYYKNAPIPDGCTPLNGTTGTYYSLTDSSYVNRFGQTKSILANYYYNYNYAKGQTDSGTVDLWWFLRSPRYNSVTSFAYINNHTYASSCGAYKTTVGVSPAFCV